MEIKKEFRPYLYGGVCIFGILYFAVFSLLALLAAINDIAGYPLYNFLGSNVDLRPAILQLLPAQNEFHLQKWNSMPIVSFIFGLTALFIFVYFTIQSLKEIWMSSKIKFFSFILSMSAISIVMFGDLYTLVAKVFYDLATLA